MINLRRDMVQGLMRLRILRAAIGGTVSGVELSEDLAIAGPGPLYPVLHDLEKGDTVAVNHERWGRSAQDAHTRPSVRAVVERVGAVGEDSPR